MDNFDLRDYLQDNKLLKEEKQPVDEAIATVGMAVWYAKWLAASGGISSLLVAAKSIVPAWFLDSNIWAYLKDILTTISTAYFTFKGVVGFKNLIKEWVKSKLNFHSKAEEYDKFRESNNVFNDPIKKGTLGKLRFDIEKLERQSKKDGEESGLKYPDSTIISYYEDGIEHFKAYDDLRDALDNIEDKFKKLNKEIQETREKTGKVPEELLRDLDQASEEYSTFTLEFNNRTAYIDDIRIIVAILLREIERRGLGDKVEKYTLKMRRLPK